MNTRSVQAGDIPVNGMFIWQNQRLYIVISQDDDFYSTVKCIASRWTNNPYDRWQYLEHSEEHFNGYCQVDELI